MILVLTKIADQVNLHPEAAAALLNFEEARKAQVLFQAPQCGELSHQFGLGIDVDVDLLLEVTATTKTGLDAMLEQHGWYCHRRDGQRGLGDNHYNYLGALPEKYLAKSGVLATSRAAELLIEDLYGEDFVPDRATALALAEVDFRPLPTRPEGTH